MLFLLACTGPSTPSESDTPKVEDIDGDGLLDEEDCAPEDASAGATVRRHADADGDGYGDPAVTADVCPDDEGWVEDATDCDDGSAAVYPGAPEIWYDGADEDCSGGSDFDQDGDGYPRESDCDDQDASRFPDETVPEIWYNGIDENCDGNDGDQDGDGWYLAGYPFDVPATYAGRVADCWDDPSATQSPLNGLPEVGPGEVYPGADDTPYDGIDANCDAHDDFDADYDGQRTSAWEDAGGAVGPDCDDTNPAIPAPNEDCGTAGDDNCDGGTNDLDAVGCSLYYPDADGDGFGVGDPACLCEAEGTYAAHATGDCADGDAGVYPGRAEVCDGVDQDCDGTVDDGVTHYVDDDGDGYGGTATACTGATVSGDCDDTDPDRHPGATELCDGVDNACTSSWTAASEAGTVSVVSSTGAVSDATASWAAGTAGRPASIMLPSNGTVNVCAGTWYVSLTLPGRGGSVRVQGMPDGGDVVLDGGGTSQIALLSDSTGPVVDLVDLTFQNGYGANGGCIYAGAVQLTLDGVTVQSCTSTGYGGGLYQAYGSLIVLDSTFEANLAATGGGGLQVEYADLWMEGSSILDNVAQGSGTTYGAGLVSFPYGYGEHRLVDTTIRGNTAWSTGSVSYGGGYYFYSSSTDALVLENVTFDSNATWSDSGSVYGAAAYVYPSGGDVSITGGSVVDNTAWPDGSALSGGLALIGGAGASTLSVSGVSFERNVIYTISAGSGGALYVGDDYYEVNLDDCTFSDNGIWNPTDASELGAGGAAYLWFGGRLAGMTNLTVSGNSATTGGGVYAYLSSGVRVSVEDSTFDNNVGDGFYYQAGGTTETLDLSTNVFAENAGAGLAVYAGSGTDAAVTMPGSYAADSDFAANTYGIKLLCGAYGGTCSITRGYADFASSWGANTSCDVSADSRCYTGVGDDVILSCSTSGTQTTCSW